MTDKFRRSRWSYFPSYLFVIIMIATGLKLYDSGSNGIAYLFFAAGIIVLMMLEILIRRYVLILEQNQIIMKKGFTTIQTRTTRYSDVIHVSIYQNIFQRLFGYGRLEIDTSGTSEVEIVMPYICKPTKIERLIREKLQNAAMGRVGKTGRA